MHDVVCMLHAKSVSRIFRAGMEAVIYNTKQPIAGILRTDALESTGTIHNNMLVACPALCYLYVGTSRLG